MSQTPDPNMPLFPSPQTGKSPQNVALLMGLYVTALVKMILWGVIACAAIAVGWGALRGIWWFVQYASQALGL